MAGASADVVRPARSPLPLPSLPAAQVVLSPTAGPRERALRIGLVAGLRFPVAQPFAGGLEAHTWSLARSLTAWQRSWVAVPGPRRAPARLRPAVRALQAAAEAQSRTEVIRSS